MSNNKDKNFKSIIRETIAKNSSKKKITNNLITILLFCFVIIAIIPLASILMEVVKNGVGVLSFEFLFHSPGSIVSGGGGIGPAIQGTLLVVGLAALIGAPVGILVGVFLSEYSSSNRVFAYFLRLFNDVLTGIPSIVIGITAYITIVLTMGSFSVMAGAFALSIIMIPIVARVCEETLKLVPNTLREAAYGLGLPKWKVVWHIVIKGSKSGILTSIVLAISRITGETAPLIMTILGTSLFFSGFNSPVDALPLRIWRLASQPYPSAHEQGWGAALLLILLVLSLSIALRMFAQKRRLAFKSTT
ncbi:phosphate ABC transporter permease PstA [Candidatus Nitrosocosmicus franklandus]|uniref:Phosphate transport system permease protein PstA n=1 Tax=Candidatus Nitrosocosmicus franklandianus TaxID=1798806 RepID=A0A484I8S9_9ARCH|nr:phosphate ABC transporter permease PstA [Candidatus Nitrosocosmicus franklandus]VFJ14161.1 Phosphate transport system permease protein PstA [Candidatus Nitrosocosmicus franklandus]